MNEVKLSGRIYRPAFKVLPSGTSVWEASIGVSKKVKEEWKTDFFSLVAFGKVAEQFSAIEEKADVKELRGSLTQEKWEDNGKKRERIKVVVWEIALKDAPPPPADPTDDDLPF